MLVRELMTGDPMTVTPETTTKAAVGLMARHRVSSLPVVDPDGRVLGVVTEVDLIRDAVTPDIRAHLLPRDVHRPAPADHVSDVMSSPAVTVQEATDLAAVVALMSSARLKSFPVVDADDRVVGVISRSDVIRTRARADGEVAGDIDALFGDLGHHDWMVEVQEGVASIAGPDNDLDRSIAEVAANTVRGVVAVEVR